MGEEIGAARSIWSYGNSKTKLFRIECGCSPTQLGISSFYESQTFPDGIGSRRRLTFQCCRKRE